MNGFALRNMGVMGSLLIKVMSELTLYPLFIPLNSIFICWYMQMSSVLIGVPICGLIRLICVCSGTEYLAV